MACIRRRKNGNGYVYDIDFTFRGKRIVRSARTSELSVAKQILKDIEGRIARGVFNLEEYQQKHVLLSKFFEEYFDYAKSYKSEQTIVNERNYTRKLIAFLGDISMRSIDARQLDKWKAHLLSSVNATTFNIERRTLQAAFSVAVRWGYLKENPFKGIQKAKHEERRLYLEYSELKCLFGLITHDLQESTNSRDRRFLQTFQQFLLFLVNTGLRRAEALRLRKSEIDFHRGLIHVTKTKSKQARIVPLNSVSRKIAEGLGEDLFGRLYANHVSRKFGSYLTKAGLVGFKLHSLRHTFSTNLISQGVDIYTVSRLLGHSDIRTSLIYAKTRVDALQDAVRRLEDPGQARKKSVRLIERR